ncbi:MAG: hypothetical protein FWD83_01260, partial [Promicromonosporaceae bacterium]|nr:hypothetical protein [Promicromonosporaceae bacterium]
MTDNQSNLQPDDTIELDPQDATVQSASEADVAAVSPAGEAPDVMPAAETPEKATRWRGNKGLVGGLIGAAAALALVGASVGIAHATGMVGNERSGG